MAGIDPGQDYDAIHTLTFAAASGTCNIRLYRGSSSAFSGTVYYRAGTSGAWTALPVSGTATTVPVTSTIMQIGHNWNRAGNDYMTPSFRGQTTNLVGIDISLKAALTGSVGNDFMREYARDCSSLVSLAVPDTSNVTAVGNSFMSNYAYDCSSLMSLAVPDTSNVTAVGNAFMYFYARGCSSLASLAVPDTSNVTTAGGNFMTGYARGCSSLASLAVPDTSNVTAVGIEFMYQYAYLCSSLVSLELPDNPGWFTTNNTNWSVPSSRLGVLKGRVQSAPAKTAWEPLTANGKTLHTNYIRSTADVVFTPPGLPVRQFIGGTWQQIGVLKAWNGTEWVKPKVWNGTAWE